jgi:hypothetical protein
MSELPEVPPGAPAFAYPAAAQLSDQQLRMWAVEQVISKATNVNAALNSTEHVVAAAAVLEAYVRNGKPA